MTAGNLCLPITPITALRGLHGILWLKKGDAWTVVHRFGMGLVLDATEASAASAHHRSQLHLPSTGLPVLQLLRRCLQSSGCVSLDVDMSGQSTSLSLGSCLEELLERICKLNHLSAAARAEAKDKLDHGSTAGEEPNMFCLHSQISEGLTQAQLLMKPGAGEETLEIFLCPLQSLDSGTQPVLALTRLPLPLARNSFAGENSVLRYVALVLCSEVSTSSMDLAKGLGCGLATVFMNETFVEAVGALPKEKPEGVINAFDNFLSNVIIVPTVYIPNSRLTPEGVSEQLPDSLLVDSLAKKIEKIAINCKLSSQSSPDELNKDPDPILPGIQDRTEKPLMGGSEGAKTPYLQINKFCIPDDKWHLTHRLMQGLEVDVSASPAAKPRMLSISMQALAAAWQLITPASVALDVPITSLKDLSDVVLDQLRFVGMPSSGVPEVKRMLHISDQAESVGSHRDDLFGLTDIDEACLLLEIPNSQLQISDGYHAIFLRFQLPSKLVSMPLSSQDKIPRFLFIFVGPQKSGQELGDLVKSMAVLTTDEDLMSRLDAASDVNSFVVAFEARMQDLIVIPHTGFTNQDVQPSTETPRSNRSAKDQGAADQSRIHARRPSLTSLNSLDTTGSDWGVVGSMSSLPSSMSFADAVPTKQCIKKIITTIQFYSLPLVLGVTTALVWSNIDEHSYHDFSHKPIFKDAKIFGHDMSLHFIVNDIFMCFFFGLAIKEVTEAVLPGGSLSPIRRAANPLFATLGGVFVPVAVYIICVLILDGTGAFDSTMCAVEAGGTSDGHRRLGSSSSNKLSNQQEVCELSAMVKGWGVPTATDISLAWMFALIIFGSGHPAINVLLLLAIVDDALGMVIIAAFYPDPENPVVPWWLGLVLAAMLLAFIMRRLNVPFWSPYIFVAGPLSWLGLLKAHVHPALALVFVVPFMPAKLKKKVKKDDSWGKESSSASLPDIDENLKRGVKQVAALLHDGPKRKRKKTMVAALKVLHDFHSAPLHEFEHSCKLPVDVGMLFFGLANAGVQLGQVGGVTVSVVVALAFGKTIGIASFSLLAAQMGFALPAGVTVVDLFAMSALGGVGLTVALFVANEAFVDPGLQGQAKMGAVLSVFCAGLAWLIKIVGDMVFNKKSDDKLEEVGQDECEEEPESPDSPISAKSWASSRSGSGVVDEVLADDILQVMWTARKYRARGAKLPLQKIVVSNQRSPTKQRSASKQRSPSKQNYNASYPVRSLSKESAPSLPRIRSLSKERPASKEKSQGA